MQKQTLSAVIGKLMKEGKTDEVDSTKAQVNNSNANNLFIR